MRKIITVFGALIALAFMFSTWIHLNPKFPLGLYSIAKAMPSLGFIVLGLALIALFLLIVPFFLRNPLRRVLIISFSVISLILLLAFTTFKDDLNRGNEIPTLGIAWFGSLFGFFIAFLGAFVKTKPSTNSDGVELPVKSSIPILATIIPLICFAVSLLAYLFLMPPFRSFPMSVDGMPRTTKVQYRKDETFPGVYASVYGMSVIHTLEKKNSADEAKEQIKKIRESIKKDAEQSFNRWKNTGENKFYEDSSEIEKLYRKDSNSVFLADEDKPENDYVVYVSAGRANVAWANGKWFCTVMTPKTDDPYSELSPAKNAFGFAASLPYPPNNTTPPLNQYRESFTLYSFVKRDLPLLISEWGLVVIPLIIAIPFILLIPFLLLRRKPA
ncbi:MAG TPA: hypothetical protein PKY82_18170 [Pyrinomonadaceae bacterium]|nr:hypothetical protein [Pyrinomonadaceae bacterium]